MKTIDNEDKRKLVQELNRILDSHGLVNVAIHFIEVRGCQYTHSYSHYAWILYKDYQIMLLNIDGKTEDGRVLLNTIEHELSTIDLNNIKVINKQYNYGPQSF